jgi:hypothetical protein
MVTYYEESSKTEDNYELGGAFVNELVFIPKQWMTENTQPLFCGSMSVVVL